MLVWFGCPGERIVLRKTDVDDTLTDVTTTSAEVVT